MDLHGRVALVTGSASGIGKAVAELMAAHGAGVVVNSRSSVEAGEELAASLPEATYVQADVTDAAGIEALVGRAVDRFGRLDVLVNNAATTVEIPHQDLDAATPEIWHRLLDLNVVAPSQLVAAAAPVLRRDGGGAVVNVSSLAGRRPVGSSIPYAVSKAALNHLTQLLANTLSPEIRVNAVAPGFIDTPWTAQWPERHKQVAETAPLRRVGQPEDIAHACVFAATASYMTGEVVGVDGGRYLR